MVTKLRLTCLIGLFIWVSSAQFPLRGQIMASIDQGPEFLHQENKRLLSDVLKELGEHWKVFFTYEVSLLDGVKVSYRPSKSTKIESQLNTLLKGTNLNFKKIEDRYFIIFQDKAPTNNLIKELKKERKKQNKGQKTGGVIRMKELNKLPVLPTNYVKKLERIINGVVTDASGEPMIGVTVVAKGTEVGTATDIDGSFSLDVPSDANTLVFTFIGYQTLEVNIDGQSTVNVTLQEDVSQLEEILVVGYGTQGRGSVTSAIDKISGDEIKAIPVANPTQAIQGRSAGVIVTNQGAPGQDPIIRIRGLTTPNNNNPLIVIDGVPAGGLSSVNPNDVESIEVLKDASAASIYGSRAAGGVILITTKRGKSGAPRVTFDAYVGTQSTANRLDLLNTEQYITVMSEQQVNGGLPVPPRFDDASIRNTDIDYQDEVFQNGIIMDYSLGVSGGTENARYLFSLNYLNQEGIVTNNDFERYSIRLNSDYNLWDRVNVGQTLLLSLTERNDVRNQGGRAIFEHTTKFAPYLQPFDSDNLGGYNGPDQIDNNDAENPLRVLNLGTNTQRSLKLLGNVYVELDIIDGLKARTSIGMDAAFNRSFSFLPAFFDGEFHQSEFATINENRTTFYSPVWTNTLSYNKSFGPHNVGAVAGYEVQDFTTENLSGSGRNELTSSIETPGDFIDDVVGGGLNEDGLVSFFGRVNYDFGGRYLFQAAIRRDGYSRFGPNNKYGTFPSVSVGWNIARESFLASIPTISNLKLRGSWGRVGNNNALGRYEYQPTVSSNFTYNFGGQQVTGSTIPGLANEDLKWETTTMVNVGFDLGLFEDAITLSAEYFTNTTEDVLFSVPLANSLGLDQNARVNTGEVESRGFEFTLGVQNRKGAFKWSIDANLATQENEVLSIGLGNPINGRSWQGDVITRVEEGQPIYFFQGWKVDRLFQESDFDADGNLLAGIPTQDGAAPGDIKFMDIAGPEDDDGNPTGPDGVIDANDRTNLGSPIPEFTYGLVGNLEWKNFDFSIFFQGVGGNKIFKAYAYWTQGMTRVFNGEEVLINRWTPTNTTTDVPRAVSGDPNRNARASDRFIDDGDYLRIKTLTIGYTLDLPNQTWLSNLRFFVSAQNLATFTDYEGYDPEVSVFQGANFNNAFGMDLGQLPQARTFLFGVQAGF